MKVAEILNEKRNIVLRKYDAEGHSVRQASSFIVMWNKLFINLGINGVVDDGDGIIHPNEPCQAVFFNKLFIDSINIYNNSVGRDIYDEQHHFKKSQVETILEKNIENEIIKTKYDEKNKEKIIYEFFKCNIKNSMIHKAFEIDNCSVQNTSIQQSRVIKNSTLKNCKYVSSKNGIYNSIIHHCNINTDRIISTKIYESKIYAKGTIDIQDAFLDNTFIRSDGVDLHHVTISCSIEDLESLFYTGKNNYVSVSYITYALKELNNELELEIRLSPSMLYKKIKEIGIEKLVKNYKEDMGIN
jgi:hypothetical protein